MRSLKISAFADEYADSFEEQLTALNEFEIENIEIRFLNGKNISVLKRNEVTEAKKKLDAFGINVSAIGSPIGKIQLDGDINDHLETAKRIFESANIFDTRYIRVFSFYAPNGKDIADMKSEVLYYLEKVVVFLFSLGHRRFQPGPFRFYDVAPHPVSQPLGRRHAVQRVVYLHPVNGEKAVLPELAVAEHLCRQVAELDVKAQVAAQLLQHVSQHVAEDFFLVAALLVFAFAVSPRLGEQVRRYERSAPAQHHEQMAHYPVAVVSHSHARPLSGSVLYHPEQRLAVEELFATHWR